jgi:hypothetical protein
MESLNGSEIYAVRLAWRGLRTRLVLVNFADEASELFASVRNQNGFGASDMKAGCGDLLDGTGKLIGKISYNGRIWKTLESTRSDRSALQ